MIAALYVREDGPYMGRADVDPWPESRDARKYAGPWPTVQHPPCPRWGNLWWTARHLGKGLGDDDGCFAASLASLREWGGVLEHPEGSRAFGPAPGFSLGTPTRGGWTQPDPMWRPREWVCSVDQGRYGHMARKRTWLLYVGDVRPLDLDWRDGSTGVWVASGPGAKTAAERAAKGITLMVDSQAGKDAKELTPPAFAEALIEVARRSVENQSHRQRELTPPAFADRVAAK